MDPSTLLNLLQVRSLTFFFNFFYFFFYLSRSMFDKRGGLCVFVSIKLRVVQDFDGKSVIAC